MKSKKIKKLLRISVLLVYYVIIAILKTIFVDIFKNIKQAFIFSFYPERKNQINRDLEASKLARLLDERLKTVERLLYAVYNDPEYIKTNKGKDDLNTLKKGVK